MTYKTKDLAALSPLAKPLAQLPPFPAMKKRRRCTVKTTEAPAAEIDQPENRIDEKTPPGYEPQPPAIVFLLLGSSHRFTCSV